MDIEKEIKQCQDSMGQIWRIVENLQNDGLDPKDPLFDDLADKSWRHMFRWEVLSALDSKQAFKSYHKHIPNERIIPERYLREFETIRFQGLNPNDHYQLQN